MKASKIFGGCVHGQKQKYGNMTLKPGDREKLANFQTSEYRKVQRAKIILLSAEGMSNIEIASSIGVHHNWIYKAAHWEESEKAEDPESINNRNITINSSPISDTGKETDAGKAEDVWGLDDIMKLFDIWGWQPSSNPTSLIKIADMAGNPEISFYTEESEKQFLSIEWSDYVFKEAKTNIFNSDSQGLWGHLFYVIVYRNRWKISRRFYCV